MTRQIFVSVVSMLILISSALNAVEPIPKKAALPRLNQVFVKIIMPVDSAEPDKEQSVVESWIVDDLKKLGQAKFSAVTGWVPLERSPLEPTDVWDGVLDKRPYCPVGGDIERAKGSNIKVHLSGWSPGGAFLTVPLKDEPGSRVIAAVKGLKSEHGMPYVAVFISPPPQKPAAPIARRK